MAVGLASACRHTQRLAQPDHAGGPGEPSEKKEQGASERRTGARVPPREGRPAVSASPEGLMNPGSARKIQEALRGKGYLRSVSGELDEPTSGALRRFQHDEGLAETGAPDRETLRKLGVDPKDVYKTAPGESGHVPGAAR